MRHHHHLIFNHNGYHTTVYHDDNDNRAAHDFHHRSWLKFDYNSPLACIDDDCPHRALDSGRHLDYSSTSTID